MFKFAKKHVCYEDFSWKEESKTGLNGDTFVPRPKNLNRDCYKKNCSQRDLE
jgi:hypothetical protein